MSENRSDSRYLALLSDLSDFVRDEQAAGHQRLLEIWQRPLGEKLEKGWTQSFTRVEKGDEPNTLWAYPSDGESRFREGDLLTLHAGSPLDSPLCRQLSLELEDDGRWLLRFERTFMDWTQYTGGRCYADPDALDLTNYYEQTLKDIATSQIGREVVLPLLLGEGEILFDDRDVTEAEQVAKSEGFNGKQAEAAGKAFGALQIACIQGPPGTGKTRVLAFAARLMVARGERILMTSHTHTAINNALNKIHAQGVPTVKVGAATQRRGLEDAIACVPALATWDARPERGGYVIGATPFATCTTRLENCEFDCIVFDEASQITVPLALMAMRKGKRFIFVGDQKQLPPVLLSRSVLAKDTFSVFAKLTSQSAEHNVMLEDTYRMNRWLTQWPSRTYYDDLLRAVGPNRERRLVLNPVAPRFVDVFESHASAVFIPTAGHGARTRNRRDAELVADLCHAAIAGGLPPSAIGVVSPYRAQARAIRNLLVDRHGHQSAREIVVDTVERMQGQERELIIFSLATADQAFLGVIAEFFFQPERLNVSITRAISKLIVIGPEVGPPAVIDDLRLAQWIEQYRDMVAQCHKVDL